MHFPRSAHIKIRTSCVRRTEEDGSPIWRLASAIESYQRKSRRAEEPKRCSANFYLAGFSGISAHSFRFILAILASLTLCSEATAGGLQDAAGIPQPPNLSNGGVKSALQVIFSVTTCRSQGQQVRLYLLRYILPQAHLPILRQTLFPDLQVTRRVEWSGDNDAIAQCHSFCSTEIQLVH